MEFKHDEAFLQILKEEQNIINFFDAFFGFMHRCTDFYIDQTPEQKLGFPPGVAEDLVLKVLHKWKSKSKSKSKCNSNKEDQESRSQKELIDLEVPELGREVEIRTPNILKLEITEGNENIDAMSYVTPVQPSDSYNGAIREHYTWSQTINDLDVLVNIPNYIRKAKELRVDINSNRIRISAETKTLQENNDQEKYSEFNSNYSNEWSSIFDGELSFKTHREESIWCIVPGKYVNIHLEKAVERWWEALIKGEPNIELNKIDCSRPIDDLGINEQMKVQELMWNHQQKLLGKPTSDQINLEKVLKKAWNVDGSPFNGLEYDPSVVNFN